MEPPKDAGAAGGRPPTLHVLAPFYSAPMAAYSHDAYSGKIIRFAKTMRPLGWRVIEYANGDSESEADVKVQILSVAQLHRLCTRKGDDPTKAHTVDAVIGSVLWKGFHQRLEKALRKHVHSGDVVCHFMGRSHVEFVKLFPKAYHIEVGVGYNEPCLAFRIYESSAWLHFHLGKERAAKGHNYNWVVPMSYDLADWDISLQPDADVVLYFGRIVADKGMNVVCEIARRLRGTGRRLVMCGQGDAAPWLKEGGGERGVLEYRLPVQGRDRSPLLGSARCVLVPTDYIEPFGSGAVEAMLCGTPVLAVNYGAFRETVIHGVTGYRCTTLGDWLEGIEAAGRLDRARIAWIARKRYSLETCGHAYDVIFRQLRDLGGKGWFNERSFQIQGAAERPPVDLALSGDDVLLESLRL